MLPTGGSCDEWKILAKNELSVEEDKMNAKAIDVHFPISWMLGCVFV
jgi:hypothetical protein